MSKSSEMENQSSRFMCCDHTVHCVGSTGPVLDKCLSKKSKFANNANMQQTTQKRTMAYVNLGGFKDVGILVWLFFRRKANYV